MNRRKAVGRMVAGGLVGAGLATTGAARGQDFGRLLEKAGKDLLKNQLSPENVERTLKPLENGEALPVKTADGWTLVAHRFRPEGPPRPGASPVILCHGLSYNALFFNLDPSVSFAKYLSGRGFDVWLASLRGSGLSQKWVAKLDAAPTMLVGGAMRRLSGGKVAPTGYATVDPKFARWTLDDHIAYDLPAIVKLVRHHTRAPEVSWVGHSMGGIVALGHLGRFQNPGIGRLATVGSQVTMPNGQVAMQFVQELIVTRQGQLTGQIVADQFAREAKTSVDNMFFNEQHTSPAVYQALTTSATDVPSIGLLQQYLVLGSRGELYDASKQFNYARSMGNVQVPIFLSCGSADQLAPPPCQQQLQQLVGSADKSLVVFGRAGGFAADCGHNDALVGLTSRQQVFPTIERFLIGAGPA